MSVWLASSIIIVIAIVIAVSAIFSSVCLVRLYLPLFLQPDFFLYL